MATTLVRAPDAEPQAQMSDPRAVARYLRDQGKGMDPREWAGAKVSMDWKRPVEFMGIWTVLRPSDRDMACHWAWLHANDALEFLQMYRLLNLLIDNCCKRCTFSGGGIQCHCGNFAHAIYDPDDPIHPYERNHDPEAQDGPEDGPESGLESGPDDGAGISPGDGLGCGYDCDHVVMMGSLPITINAPRPRLCGQIYDYENEEPEFSYGCGSEEPDLGCDHGDEEPEFNRIDFP